jgi:predicted P-loop ATPase
MNEYIKRYCELGFKVFPVVLYLDKDNKVVKAPLIEGWQSKATSNYQDALQMFEEKNAKAIGVVTGKVSGISVLDIDVKNGENGFLSLDEAGIDLPTTACSLTPSGGRHYIFKYTDKMKTSVKTLPGIDCRNDRGFIVVAPSAYPHGTLYEWIIDQEPWNITAIEAPENITDLFKAKNKESTVPRQVPELIKAGERNDKLFKEACSMRERGYNEEEIMGGLKIFNKTRCQTPLPEDELSNICASSAKYKQGDQKTGKTRKRLLLTLLQVMAKDDQTNKLFGYNEFTDDVEFIKAPPWDPLLQPGKIISDVDMISLKVYLSTKHAFEPPTGTIGEAIAYEAQNLKYHPVRAFVHSLTWDGKPRLDTWLNIGAGVEQNAYTKAVARKVMVAAVARVFQPGCMFQYMLVLEGDQGIGKSRLVSILGGSWFTELNITEEDKDVVEYMRGRWIIEVPEMVCARKTEVDHLKAFITKTKDRVRLAYRRNATDFPRQSILIGTINPSGDNTYLRDDTGGRRFWPVMCTNINIAWLQNNRDQLIAEAYDVFKKGQEELHLTDPEVQEIAKRQQEDRQEEDVWMPYITEYLNKLPPGSSFTIGEIADYAVNIKKDKLDKAIPIRIGKILKKLNIPNKRMGHDNIRTYFPVKKQVEMLPENDKNNW